MPTRTETQPTRSHYRLIFGQGGELDCTSDLDVMRDRIAVLSGEKDANAFVRYVEDNRKKLHRAKACLQEPWNGPTDIFSSASCEQQLFCDQPDLSPTI